MQDWRKIVGRNVRRIRQEREMTQENLAFEAELDLTYVGGIERGKRNPSLLVLARIAEALSVHLTKLLAEQFLRGLARARVSGRRDRRDHASSRAPYTVRWRLFRAARKRRGP